jgi:hypothetical protein
MWRDDPSLFFKDVTGLEPFGYQRVLLEWAKDMNNRKLVIVGGTGGGKTFCLAVIGLWSVVCLPPELGKRVNVAMAAGSLAQSRRTFDYVMDFAMHSPIIRDWIKDEPLKTEIRFKDNSWIAPLPSSDTQLYNLHCPIFIIDEAALAGDKVIEHAPRIVGAYEHNRMIISGHFIDDPRCYISRFADVWTNDVEYPRSEWTKIHYSSVDIPWMQKELETARKLYSAEKFKAVWEAQLPALDNTLLDVHAIRECRSDSEFIPSPLNKITMAIDWGFGPSAAAIVVTETIPITTNPLDNEYNILFAEEYPQKTGPWMQKKVDEMAKTYNVNKVRADSSHSQENYRLRQAGWAVEDMVFKALKDRMVERLRVTIQQKKIHIWKSHDVLLKELVAYRKDAKKDDHLVDSLMMCLWESQADGMSNFFFRAGRYGRASVVRGGIRTYDKTES